MKRFKNILCVIEPDEADKPVLARAVTLAENNQASLTVAGVVECVTAGIGMPDGGPISAELQANLVRAHEQQLGELVEPFRSRVDIQLEILKGVPFLEIIREVLRNGRDLVVKATDSTDWFERLFSSDDMHLLRKCPCPVWMLKPEAPKTFRRILAAVDVQPGESQAESQTRRAMNIQTLELASSLALSEFAELHVVHVWDAVGESAMRGAFMRMTEDQITDYVEQVKKQHAQALKALLGEIGGESGQDAMDYLKPKTHLIKGWARKAIPELAKHIHAELIVMGTVARTGVHGLIIGNTAETILGQIDCSVLAVKPPGFETPVTVEE